MDWLFESLALWLDALPAEGRVMLLAALLSIAFTAFSRRLPESGSAPVNVLYRKAALVCLIAIPIAVYLFGIRLPVTVEEVTRVTTRIPAYVTWALLLIWVAGGVLQVYRLSVKVRATGEAVAGADELGSLKDRLAHWQNRLNVTADVKVVTSGTEAPWHVASLGRLGGAAIVLPSPARNWPVGVVDVILLHELAELKQKAWHWYLFARVVQAVYWPFPWVSKLADALGQYSVNPAEGLARAAYRDPEGWRRDFRNFETRMAMLDADADLEGRLLRLPPRGVQELDEEHSTTRSGTFEERMRRAHERLKERTRDPHEQAYWLVAVASILVATATTLTRVQEPPEQDFEPLFQQWEITMFRTVSEYGEEKQDEDKR